MQGLLMNLVKQGNAEENVDAVKSVKSNLA